MSYEMNGISFSGLGEVMTVNLRAGDSRVRALQTELARIGFLEPGSGATGIDGKWGGNTENALRNAARYVYYSGTPFTRTGSTVTVPDQLLGLIRAANVAPSGTEGRVAAPPDTTTTIAPTPGGAAPGTTPGTTPGIVPPEHREVEESWTDRQILGVRAPVFVAGSVGLLLAVGAGVYFMSTSASPQRAVAQNRRRRRGR